MANPYYIDPSMDFSRGFGSLGTAISRVRETDREKQALDRKTQISQQAIDAYKSDDPDAMAEIILKNTVIGKSIFELLDRRKAISDDNYASSLAKTLTEIEETGSIKTSESPLEQPTLSGLSTLGTTKTPDKLEVFKSLYKKNPDVGQRVMEYEFARIKPEQYKAWAKIYKPETEDSPSPLKKLIEERTMLLESGIKPDDDRIKAYDRKISGAEKTSEPTQLSKLIDEKQALLDSGVSLNDKRIKAYDRKISGAEKTSEPTQLSKLIDERDELLNLGVPPEDEDVKAYNRKIFGEDAKTYAPSPLKKLITEREQYIDDGEPEDGPIIKAYDNRIAGIDIDIEEMTQGEIDMWGAWVNLSGKMPSVGRGKQATKIRAAILKSAGKQAIEQERKAAGISEDAIKDVDPKKAALGVVGDQADTKSIQGSLNFLEKQRGSMGSFIQNMDEQIAEIEKLKKDLFTFDTRLLNIPLRMLRGRIIGSPLQAKYDLYLAEIEREISKLASNATSSIAAMSVEEVKAWSKIHDKALSTNDMWELLTATRKATEIRMGSIEDELGRTRQKMRTRQYPALKSEGPSTIGTQEEYDALESGATYINKRTGQKMRKP